MLLYGLDKTGPGDIIETKFGKTKYYVQKFKALRKCLIPDGNEKSVPNETVKKMKITFVQRYEIDVHRQYEIRLKLKHYFMVN